TLILGQPRTCPQTGLQNEPRYSEKPSEFGTVNWTPYIIIHEQCQCNNISIKNIQMDCDNFFDVGKSDKYRLVDFTFQDITCTDKKMAFDANLIENTVAKKVNITPREKSNGLKTTGDADGLK
ncbi:hypothetical protein ACTNEK_14475, partial [Segatella copri]